MFKWFKRRRELKAFRNSLATGQDVLVIRNPKQGIKMRIVCEVHKKDKAVCLYSAATSFETHDKKFIFPLNK